MKKRIILYYIPLLFIACKAKTGDYSCTCDVTPSGGNTVTRTDTVRDKTAEDASTMCNDWGQRMVNGNGKWKCVTKPI